MRQSAKRAKKHQAENRRGQRNLSRNALKHGLAGNGVVLAEELNEEVERHVEERTHALQPRIGPEAWLVQHAAIDATRVDDATRRERAKRGSRIRRHVAEVEGTHHEQVEGEKLGGQLMDDRDNRLAALRKLRSTSAGCDWLIGR